MAERIEEDRQEPIDGPEWIRKNIKMRVCSHFIPVVDQKENENNKCQCGYEDIEHTQKAMSTKGSQPTGGLGWDYTKHSQTKETNAFGSIKFKEGNVGKYVRVDADTNMKDMLHLIRVVWGLKNPNVIFSVTGGAISFKMTKRLKRTFSGFSALTTGAYIVTGGPYAGVMKDVREAIKDFGVDSKFKKPLVSICIAAWGCIHTKNSLEQKEGGLVDYTINEEQEDVIFFLDPYHTHYIFVDDGTQHKFEKHVDIPFREKLETEIVKTGIGDGDNAEYVPIVMLVLNGGQEALKTIQKSIENNIPVVIVKGSGRIADILAHAFNITEEYTFYRTRRCTMTEGLWKEVKEMLENEGMSCDKTQIEKCLENRNLISVFEPDNQFGNKEIDSIVLQALLRANKDRVMDYLQLVLAWNRIDIAKREILSCDHICPTSNLDDEMFCRILHRTDLVELFIAHSVSPSKRLTKDRLDRLYRNIPRKCLLQTLLKIKGKKDLLDNVGSFIKSLIGDLYRPIYTNKTQPDSDKHDDGMKQEYKNPSQELFIWSLLMLRQDMAKLFWAEGQDAIASALVANRLLRALKTKTKNTEIVNKLQCNINEWSDLAVGVLRECYAFDEQKAQDLLERKLRSWGNKTCMEIAVKADNIDFISQPACQSLLNRTWMGKLAEDNCSWRLLVCVLFPPLILVLLDFQSDDEQDENNSAEEIESGTAVACFTEKKDETNNVYTIKDRLYSFYKAPVIIFMNNVISYLVFLGLFTYILIFNFNPKVSAEEIVLMIWFFTIILEEIRQVLQGTTNPLAKLKRYITDMWNILDMVTIGLFVIGMFLRSVPQAETFEAARVFLALSFVSFCLRLLHIFSVHKGLGPKLVMIGRMVQDLVSFLVILMVFVVSYAVASHSILFPNTPLRWYTAIEVVRKSYWNIYGELFLEEILEGAPDCTNEKMLWINGTQPRCPSETGKVVVPLLMALYMLLVNILLLNLLIAVFSNTYKLVQDNTDKHWCFQRYALINEYYTRSMLCPPFIIFSLLHLFMKWVYHRCHDRRKEPYGNFSDTEDDFHKGDLEKWEKTRANDFFQETERKDFENTSGLLKTLTNRMNDGHLEFESRLENLYEKIEELQADVILSRKLMYRMK